MLRKLSGWQRLGVVISVTWVLSISGMALSEFYSVAHSRHCRFVYSTIPVGTAWTEKRDANGIPVEPWDYDWETDDTVPKTRKLKVLVFASALTLPVVVGWLLSLGSVRVFKWVRDGFKL